MTQHIIVIIIVGAVILYGIKLYRNASRNNSGCGCGHCPSNPLAKNTKKEKHHHRNR